MTRRQQVVIVLFLAVQAAFWAWLPTVVHSAGPEVTIRAGGIRLGQPKPYFIKTGDHAVIGLLSLKVTPAGDLQVVTDFDSRTEALVYADVEEDFTMVMDDVSCGPSGGGKYINIRCEADGRHVRVNSSFFDSTIDNIWVETESIPR